MVSAIEISELNHRFDLASVDEILRWIWERFGTHAAIGTSFQGAGLVLIDVALKNGFQFPVFTIDTGKLFHETVELKGRLEDWFGVNIESVKPELNLERQTETYGSNLWDSDPNLCCNLRKVVPLERKLSTLSCWITGLRRQQSATRDRIGQLELFHLDREAGREIVKMNPLANWRKEDVWKYVRDHRIPYNPLRDQGYASIGCQPCTVRVEDAQSERAGRWDGFEKTECGIHQFLEAK